MVSGAFASVIFMFLLLGTIMGIPTYISDEEIKELLNWDTLVPAIEKAMADLSDGQVIQPSRLVMPIQPKHGAMLALPAYSDKEQALGCKVVTSFPDNKNKGLPSVLGTILFMDSDTGKLKVILEGTEITTWRTAAASVAATKNLHKGEKKILAVLGAGTQGRIHALAMKHYFNFTEVRIWNRSPEKAIKLCQELGPWAVPYTNNEACVKDADVIATTTYATSPIIFQSWVKDEAHINVVGSNVNHYSELDINLYKANGTSIFVDHMASAVKELKGLLENGIEFVGEVGQVVNNNCTIPSTTKVTIFNSLGMAVEDVVAAKLVYELYLAKQNNTKIAI